MNIISQNEHIDSVLATWQDFIGNDYKAYKNHVYRVLNFAANLHPLNPEEQEKLAIAAAFHDLGIWSHNTLDYLDPSVKLMETWLVSNGKAEWSSDLQEIVINHHKIRTVKNNTLAEVFRKADLIDLTNGKFKFGLNKNVLSHIKSELPHHGFHNRLLELTYQQFKKTPFKNPLPMLKW